MSTLVLLVGLLLILTSALIVGAVVYVVHRRPAVSPAVTAGLTAVGVLATVVGVVVNAGGR
ncbi:hypothetical protein [Streptomyces kanamyceticus]|uniref:hypothetical protein n=1 Tax=Streptomyces kanamyceticus TaxID=1967 RepID=UPI0006E2005D|nr:hypothetical protein [Streptomyces kanamyceticus]